MSAGPGRPPSRLGESFDYCRTLHRPFGRTYFLATRLLPARKRPYVHALYGFARYTDDIVDSVSAADSAARADALGRWAAQFAAALDGGPSRHPILPAVLHTITVFQLNR